MDVPRPRKSRRSQLALRAAVAICLIAGAAWAVAQLKARPPSVTRAELWTGAVTRDSFVMRVHGAGTLRPEEVRWLSAESAGRVEVVLLKAGTHVEADNAIVRLENLDLRLQADQSERDLQVAQVQALQLEREQAQQELAFQQELAALGAELSDAERRAEAYRQAAGVIVSLHESGREADRAQSLRQQKALCQHKLEVLGQLGPQQLAAARNQIGPLTQVRAVRRQMLDRLVVRAPVAGTVQQVLVEPGQWVVPGAQVAKLMVSARLEAVLRIPAEEVGAVSVGQRASVRTGFGRGGDTTLFGRVRRIAPAAQQSTVDVEVALEGDLPDGARADQTIDGAIETQHVDSTLSLPRPTGLPLGATAQLFRIDSGGVLAHRVPVQIGLVSTDRVQIVAGLREGDEVILSDLSQHSRHSLLRLE
jgi:HlyD family secretion protein